MSSPHSAETSLRKFRLKFRRPRTATSPASPELPRPQRIRPLQSLQCRLRIHHMQNKLRPYQEDPAIAKLSCKYLSSFCTAWRGRVALAQRLVFSCWVSRLNCALTPAPTPIPTPAAGASEPNHRRASSPRQRRRAALIEPGWKSSWRRAPIPIGGLRARRGFPPTLISVAPRMLKTPLCPILPPSASTKRASSSSAIAATSSFLSTSNSMTTVAPPFSPSRSTMPCAATSACL